MLFDGEKKAKKVLDMIQRNLYIFYEIDRFFPQYSSINRHFWGDFTGEILKGMSQHPENLVPQESISEGLSSFSFQRARATAELSYT